MYFISNIQKKKQINKNKAKIQKDNRIFVFIWFSDSTSFFAKIMKSFLVKNNTLRMNSCSIPIGVDVKITSFRAFVNFLSISRTICFAMTDQFTF